MKTMPYEVQVIGEIQQAIQEADVVDFATDAEVAALRAKWNGLDNMAAIPLNPGP